MQEGKGSFPEHSDIEHYKLALREIVGIYNHAISFEGGKPAGLGAGQAFVMADTARKALDLPELRSL